MSDTSLLYITTPSVELAETIGRTLVEEHLAACANILPDMQSIYRWEGSLEQASETVLILKTRTSLVSAATRRVQALHTAECPAIISLPVTGGNEAFMQWIMAETVSGTA